MAKRPTKQQAVEVTEEVIAEETVVEEVKPILASTNGARVNIRKEPSLESEVLGVLEPTKNVELVNKKVVKGFYKVKMETGFGYVKSEFVTVI